MLWEINIKKLLNLEKTNSNFYKLLKLRLLKGKNIFEINDNFVIDMLKFPKELLPEERTVLNKTPKEKNFHIKKNHSAVFEIKVLIIDPILI